MLSREFYGKARCVQGTMDKVQVITYHGTQGPTARSGAVTLTTRTGGSAHEVHDAKEGFKIAPDLQILCGVEGTNTGNYHIEDATFAAWLRKVWFLHKRTLKWSAYRIAHMLHKHDLPNHFIGLREAELAGGLSSLRGWTYHCVLSETAWCPSTHSDPAPRAGFGASTFPHEWFKRYVTYFYMHPDVATPVKLSRDGTRKGKR